MALPALVPIAEVAEALRVTAGTLRLWSSDGRFPAPYRLPHGRLAFAVVAVNEWLEAHRVNPEAHRMATLAADAGQGHRRQRARGRFVRAGTDSSAGGSNGA